MKKTTLSRIARKLGRLSPEEKKLEALGGFTMCDEFSRASLARIASLVAGKKLPGDIVECGVCNGGTAGILGTYLAGSGKSMWLYDSFEGMPPTQAIDGADAKAWVGKCKGSQDSVKEALNISGFPADKTVIRAGWFQDTFKQALPEKISILHIDADWYASVSLCLDTFYDRVIDGGYIILDDFGYWEGCREAFYEFCQRRQLKPLLERAGPTHAWWVKGRLHNRTS